MSRQGRPVGLIIAVVAVAAAALLLWMIMRSGDEDATASPKQPVAGTAGTTGAAGERPAPSLPAGSDQPGTQVVSAGEGRRAGEREPATEVIIDGRRVRDHRKDRSKPINLPPRDPPEHGRKIPPALTGQISNRMLPIVRECAASVPPEARGAKPRVTGQVVIAIKNQQVKISDTTVELSDVVGAPVDATKQCIQQKTLGITVPAADEADLENYPIQISFSLP